MSHGRGAQADDESKTTLLDNCRAMNKDSQYDKDRNYEPQQLPSSILFVCAMNAIRSPIAETLARDIFGSKVFCQSAGVRAGVADGFAQAVMAEKGYDCSSHEPIALDDLEDDYFDLIVTLSPEAHHRALELTRSNSVEVEYWPVIDPSTVAGSRDQIMDAYRQLRDSLEAKIRKRFGFLSK